MTTLFLHDSKADLRPYRPGIGNLLGLCLCLFCSPGNTAPAECEPLETEAGWFVLHAEPVPLPDVPFKDQFGIDHSFSELHGSPLLVHYWGSWCPPCLRELPSIDRLQALLWDDGLLVLPLGRDRGGPKQILEIYKEKGIRNLPVFTDRWGKTAHAHRVGTVPVTLYVDEQGREVGRFNGTIVWDSPGAVEHIRGCLGLTTPSP